MGVTSSYTMDMVYARTIKRRSGNGINASLRNVSDLIMSEEAALSAAAGATSSSSNNAATAEEGSIPPTGGIAVAPSGASEVPSTSDSSSHPGPSESSSTAQPADVSLDSATIVPSSAGDDHDLSNLSSVTLRQEEEDDDERGEIVKDSADEKEDDQGSKDSLNNNGEAALEKVANQEAEDAAGGGAALMMSTGLTCQLPAKELRTGLGLEENNLNNNTTFISTTAGGGGVVGLQHNHNVRNNNHLNNILNNNNSIQSTMTNTTTTTSNNNNANNNNNNNNNWWAPPPVQPVDLRNGKLSLMGSNPLGTGNGNGGNGGQNNMQMKFSTGNGVGVVATTENGNGATQLPKAILKCRPNSHPFQTRTLTLIPNVEMKVGRAVARHPVSEANAIFDCKVLSRNHAVLWYSDDKFYIRDTGSSNGTFVNNQRLSQTCLQSDKFEICSGDIVQFGVDVIENARKETHGCIVATIRLYLPDGRETKASQLTGVSAGGGQVLAEDLYRLHQYIQEAMLREQMLEVKMNELQRLIEVAKVNVNGNWQAMVDEDRLLNRIDILEGKVHVFQKNYGEEKLREEMRQLQDDKLDYQHAAKEALRRVYQDRYEAVQKLSGVELALRMTEDEASVLRDKFIKSESTLNETMTRLSTVQQKHDELQAKYSDLEGKLQAMEISVANEGEGGGVHNVAMMAAEKSLQDLIESQTSISGGGGDEQMGEVQERVKDEEGRRGEEKKESSGGFGKAEGLMKLFANSDLKNLVGSADIINSICNSAEEEAEEEEGESDYQEGVSVIERVLRKEEGTMRRGEQLDTDESTESVQGMSCSNLLYKLRAVERTINEMKENEAHSLESYASDASLDSVVHRPQLQGDEDAEEDVEGSDNRSVASSTTSTLRLSRNSNRGGGGGGAVMTENMRQIVDQLVEICGEMSAPIRERMRSDVGRDDDGDEEEKTVREEVDAAGRSKVVEELMRKVSHLERENESLAGDLADRPTMSQLETKVKLADDLQLELVSVQLKVAELKQQLDTNVRRYETMEKELQRLQDQEKQQQPPLGKKKKEVVVMSMVATAAKEREEKEQALDEKMLTNPMVEVEEELVLYKEKYVSLSETNISLQREVDEMRKKCDDVMQRSMMKLLMYMGPVVAVLGYFVLWPYL